jgi:phospholipid transport system substrate-binding protein
LREGVAKTFTMARGGRRGRFLPPSGALDLASSGRIAAKRRRARGATAPTQGETADREFEGMRIGRRDVVIGALALTAAGALGGRAGALTKEDAAEYVREAIDEVLALVRSTDSAEAMAPKLRDLLEKRAALPQIAKFAAGRTWREMNESQRERFVDAFAAFVSSVYARRFQDYSGETVSVGEVVDAGRKGLLVTTRVSQMEGQPVVVEWLVSDRPGRVVIADIVIEGVSLLVTQREEIAAMLEKRGGDVDKLISDLAAA